MKVAAEPANIGDRFLQILLSGAAEELDVPQRLAAAAVTAFYGLLWNTLESRVLTEAEHMRVC